MTCEEEVEFNYKFLDRLPLPIPERGIGLYEYVQLVEDTFKDEEIPEELQGRIFNFLSEYELGEYIEKRFNARIQEESRYYIWIKETSDDTQKDR